MGQGMARNILTKGWPLTVLAHRSRTAVEALVAEGAAEAPSARALAEASDVVVLCVTGSPEVSAVVEGPEGLAASGRPIKCVRSYTDDIRSTNVRHAARVRVRTGVMNDGTIVAQDIDVLFDGGAYAAGGLVPLAPYFFAADARAALPWSIAATLAALLAFGYV